MNDATGVTMNDLTSNNKDGGQGVVANNQPTPVKGGIMNGDFDFDGTQDAISALSASIRV